jgi:hypothetical protein
MRFPFALMLFVSPAWAAEWSSYESPRLGFGIDIPPGFSLSHESSNGGSRLYNTEAGRELLAVWGAHLDERDFSAEVAERIERDAADGWDISYRRETPDWVSYSGTKEGQIRYVRAIRFCDDRAAFFSIDYDQRDKEAFDPVVLRLVRSFDPVGDCG